MLTRKSVFALVFLSFFCMGMGSTPPTNPPPVSPPPVVTPPAPGNGLAIVSASASSTSGSYSPAMAIDSNNATYWRGAGSFLSRPSFWWLQMDLGKACTLTQISILWHKDYGATKYQIQGSNDINVWAKLQTDLSSAGGKANPVQKDHNLSGTYRYLRIYIEKSQNYYPIIYGVVISGKPASTLDTTAPTGSINIAGGASSTSSMDVNLALWAQDSESGLSEMKFSNDNSTWSAAETYAINKAWVLTPGPSTAKIVYVKYKDKAGNWSGAYSDTISFPNQVPKALTVVPAEGFSLVNNGVLLEASYSDANGWQDIQMAHILINTKVDGKTCLYGYYNQNTNKLYLRDDNDKNWLGGFAPGTPNIIQNSYATLNCAVSTVSGANTTLTVKWSVTFKQAFTGAKTIYIWVKDDSNAAPAAWASKGTWTVKNDQDEFVGVMQNRLVLKASKKPYYFSLANQDYLFSTSVAMVDEVFSDAGAMGTNVIRTWGFCDGHYDDGQSGSPEFAFQPQPGVYNETTFKRMDYIIKKARDNGMRLIIPLVNNWDTFGGMSKYVDWSVSASLHDQFYTDANCKYLYKNYVNYFLNRKNTLTGVIYKDDPTILVWELANEPRCPSDPSGDTLTAWIVEMSRYIKSIDQNHMVATGEEGWYSADGTDYARNIRLPDIDIGTFHILMDDMGFSEAQAMNWIRRHIDDAHILANKPAYCGEIGKRVYRTAVDFTQQMNERNRLYTSWYQEFLNRDLEGGGFWMLSADSYSDYDNYTVYYPKDTQTNKIIKDFSDNMAKRRNLDYVVPTLLLEDSKINEQQALEFQIATRNPSGFNLKFSSPNLPTGASLSSSGYFRWPNPAAGIYNIGIEAAYDSEHTIVGNMNINVADVNGDNTPRMSKINDITIYKNGGQDNAVDLWSITVDDEAVQNITFAVTSNDAAAGVTLDGNRYIDIKPTKDHFGLATVSVTATDARGLSSRQTFSLNIVNAITVPATYATITQAMSHAASGDTIAVAPGTYHESVYIISGVTLRSQSGPANTIIDATGYNYAISGYSGRVQGFTLRNASSAGVISTSSGNSLKVVNNIIENNKGQGIYFYGGRGFLISNNIIRNNNSSDYGGGIRLSDADDKSKVVNNVIINNTGTDGGGIYLSDNANALVYNNIITGNSGAYAGGIRYWSSSPTLAYNDVWNNSPANYFNATIWESISSNPQFVDGPGGNYRLSPSSSPCINTGNPDAQYNDKDGSRNDMGAYGGPDSL